MNSARTFFRYLPVMEESRIWGAYVMDAGFAFIPPGSPYPPCQHPVDHHFTWENGRILHSYQFIYITRGTGHLETRSAGLLEVKSGDLFILFPEVWHRYHPSTESGWDEYWIEFDGDYVRRLLKHPCFSAKDPVLHLGMSQSLMQLYLEAMETLRCQPPEYHLLLGALSIKFIAQTLSAIKQKQFENRSEEQVIHVAKQLLANQGGKAIPIEHFAAQFNMSYSAFRRLFKAQTGYSPRQYSLEISLNRAKELLQHSTMPINRIAEELGFESVHYFSRLIKHKTGLSPRELRNQFSTTQTTQ